MAPRWRAITLCGREWSRRAHGDEASAPTCRRCLAIMDRQFPQPALDPRFPLVVQFLTDMLLERGYATILRVPGDQQAAMRAAVRAAVRERTGYAVTSHVFEDRVSFTCQPIYDQHADEHKRLVADVIASTYFDGPPADVPPPLDWETWAAG